MLAPERATNIRTCEEGLLALFKVRKEVCERIRDSLEKCADVLPFSTLSCRV